jgi:peptide/nickel transport system substrate-binding protein
VHRPRGTIKVVDLHLPSTSISKNYAEGLVTLDRDNNYVPCLAEDLRFIDDRTVEFRLRKGVRFHNGAEFNADTLKVNWDEYRMMQSPNTFQFLNLQKDARLKVIDEFTVQFTFPRPEGLAFPKFAFFFQIAPTFFTKNKFDEKNWGFFKESAPWGTGPFKLIEGSFHFGKLSDRVVLEANENYWDRRYPKEKSEVL